MTAIPSPQRTIGSMPRRGEKIDVSTPTTIHAVGSTNAWNQIHHDARNSGRVPWTANLRDGKCPAWTAFPNQTYGTETIQANGAMGVTGDYVFYVG